MFRTLIASMLLVLSGCTPAGDSGPVVLAASSMTEALEEVADAWTAQGHARPVLSFASSAVVARQAAEGAPADLVVTADSEWMDWMAAQGLLRPGSRRDIAGNALVLVVRGDPATGPRGDPREQLQSFTGRLAIADPESVPAGRYAMAALTGLGLAEDLAGQLVPAENVRAALALVERGEVDMGVVYQTDAQVSRRVAIAARLAPDSHPPIRYPMAILSGATNADSAAFADFVASAQGQEVLAHHGFTRPE